MSVVQIRSREVQEVENAILRSLFNDWLWEVALEMCSREFLQFQPFDPSTRGYNYCTLFSLGHTTIGSVFQIILRSSSLSISRHLHSPKCPEVPSLQLLHHDLSSARRFGLKKLPGRTLSIPFQHILYFWTFQWFFLLLANKDFRHCTFALLLRTKRKRKKEYGERTAFFTRALPRRFGANTWTVLTVVTISIPAPSPSFTTPPTYWSEINIPPHETTSDPKACWDISTVVSVAPFNIIIPASSREEKIFPDQ